MITFTIPGKPCSNNRVTRRVGNRSVKSAQARDYQARVARIAWAANMSAKDDAHMRDGFEACAVTIHAYNTRIDAGNLEKCVCDGMQGVLYKDDRCVIELHVYKHRDAAGERLVVNVAAREPLSKPKRTRAA